MQWLFRLWLSLSIGWVPSAQPLLAADTGIAAAPQPWLELDIGMIGPASVDILQRALQQAQNEARAGLLIRLDTPGGALEATRTMVKVMLDSPLPIIVWVGPSGAHAGSAGAFITLAAHIAAMAPGTQIGAAHPVSGTGQDLERGSDLRTKVENDTIAFMDSIAKLRARNAEMARSFVATSVSLSAEEALKHQVIDLLAADTAQVLAQVQGRQLSIKGASLTLQGTQTVPYVKTWRQRLLEVLSNPNLFYLLFIAGLLGLGFELTHPGVFVPGVLGAIALILALISSSVLPINWGAMLLILASIGFMIAEIFIPSFGILGIGGFIGFLVGSVLLIDASQELGLTISWLTIAPAALVIVGFMFLVSYLVLRNQKARIRSGSEGLLGKSAEALEDFHAGHGQVRLEGEIWNATLRSQAPVFRGDQLEVAAIDGLTLIVKPLSPIK